MMTPGAVPVSKGAVISVLTVTLLQGKAKAMDAVSALHKEKARVWPNNSNEVATKHCHLLVLKLIARNILSYESDLPSNGAKNRGTVKVNWAVHGGLLVRDMPSKWMGVASLD